MLRVRDIDPINLWSVQMPPVRAPGEPPSVRWHWSRKLSELPGFVGHIAQAGKAAVEQRWMHYKSLRFVEGAGYHIDPTVLLYGDAAGSIFMARGAHIGAHSYVCALGGS